MCYLLCFFKVEKSTRVNCARLETLLKHSVFAQSWSEKSCFAFSMVASRSKWERTGASKVLLQKNRAEVSVATRWFEPSPRSTASFPAWKRST